MTSQRSKTMYQMNGHDDVDGNNPQNDVTEDNNKNANNNGAVNHANDVKKTGFQFLVTLPFRQKCLLLSATLALFLANIVASLLGPFYTTEAVKKGMDMATVGVVFGVFQGVIFITSPFFGSHLVKLGPRFIFFAGVFVGGSCNVLFGFLQYCPGGTPFIVMSILIRAVEAVGFSGFITSCYAFVSCEFQENVGLTFSILQTAVGVGNIVGPVLGGALYEWGGFGLPFYFAGGAVFLNGLAMVKLLPIIQDIPVKRRGSMLTLLHNLIVIISVLCVFITMVGVTTIEATYAHHVQSLGFRVGIIGLFFSFLSVTFAITCSVVGHLTDTKDVHKPVIIAGIFVFGFGYLLLGPTNLLPFIPFNLTTILSGLVFIGVGMGCTFIAAMKCMTVGAIEMGFENNLDTYALVSGLFVSFQTMGASIGPLSTGSLIEAFDYPIAYTAVGICCILLAIASFILFSYRNYNRQSYDDIDTVGSVNEKNGSCVLSLAEDIK